MPQIATSKPVNAPPIALQAACLPGANHTTVLGIQFSTSLLAQLGANIGKPIATVDGKVTVSKSQTSVNVSKVVRSASSKSQTKVPTPELAGQPTTPASANLLAMVTDTLDVNLIALPLEPKQVQTEIVQSVVNSTAPKKLVDGNKTQNFAPKSSTIAIPNAMETEPGLTEDNRVQGGPFVRNGKLFAPAEWNVQVESAKPEGNAVPLTQTANTVDLVNNTFILVTGAAPSLEQPSTKAKTADGTIHAVANLPVKNDTKPEQSIAQSAIVSATRMTVPTKEHEQNSGAPAQPSNEALDISGFTEPASDNLPLPTRHPQIAERAGHNFTTNSVGERLQTATADKITPASTVIDKNVSTAVEAKLATAIDLPFTAESKPITSAVQAEPAKVQAYPTIKITNSARPQLTQSPAETTAVEPNQFVANEIRNPSARNAAATRSTKESPDAEDDQVSRSSRPALEEAPSVTTQSRTSSNAMTGENPTDTESRGQKQPPAGATVTRIEHGSPAALNIDDRIRVVEQVRTHLEAAHLTQGRQEITLRLTPDNLGELRMTLTADRSDIAASIVATNHEAGKAMSEGANTLRAALEAKGYHLSSLDVQTSPDRQFSSEHERRSSELATKMDMSMNPNGNRQSFQDLNWLQAESNGGGRPRVQSLAPAPVAEAAKMPRIFKKPEGLVDTFA